MAQKRKKNQDQPELPIQEAPDNTPGEVHAAPSTTDGNGKPVDVGASCANPTGAPPMSCLHGPLETWNVNVGTGSGLSVNGPALTAASTNPAD